MLEIKKELGFKKLNVWIKSIGFANHVISLTENLNSNSKHFRLIEQIEASAASVSANIAEGKGRDSKKEFIHFLYIARGSLYETISFLYLFVERDWITKDDLENLEIEAVEIASMLKGLINSIYSTL
jgi:four helix bundle protein